MLSQTCEYALRAVTYIAQHGQEGPVLAREIAKQTAVPLKYLQKVLRDLVRGGVLKSSRGIGGGFRLNRPARRLSLAAVIGPFDDVSRRTACPFGNLQCGEGNPCPAHERWMQVTQPYIDFLEGTTLEDLLEGNQQHKATQKRRVKGRAKKKPRT